MTSLIRRSEISSRATQAAVPLRCCVFFLNDWLSDLRLARFGRRFRFVVDDRRFLRCHRYPRGRFRLRLKDVHRHFAKTLMTGVDRRGARCGAHFRFHRSDGHLSFNASHSTALHDRLRHSGRVRFHCWCFRDCHGGVHRRLSDGGFRQETSSKLLLFLLDMRALVGGDQRR